jgi:hypothetical protein
MTDNSAEYIWDLRSLVSHVITSGTTESTRLWDSGFVVVAVPIIAAPPTSSDPDWGLSKSPIHLPQASGDPVRGIVRYRSDQSTLIQSFTL